jgi:hypothetical protein
MPQPSPVLATHRKFRCFRLDVGDVDGPPVHNRSSGGRVASQRQGELADWPSSDRTAVRDEDEPVAITPEDDGV